MMNYDEKRAYELAQKTLTRLTNEAAIIEEDIASLNAGMSNILQGEMNPEAARELQRMAFDMIRLTVDRDFNAEQMENTRKYIEENEDAYNDAANTDREPEIRFLWNGIKVNGVFEKCWYSPSCRTLEGWGIKGITIHADSYGVSLLRHLDAEVHNDTDTMTDYFEKDSCRIDRSSRYWGEVRAAYCKQEIHNIKRNIKYYEKRGWDCEDMKIKLEGYKQELAA